jgi:hypothetical protein
MLVSSNILMALDMKSVTLKYYFKSSSFSINLPCTEIDLFVFIVNLNIFDECVTMTFLIPCY